MAGVNIKAAFVTWRYFASNGIADWSSSHIFIRFAGRTVFDVLIVKVIGVAGVSAPTLAIELVLMGGMGVEASI